MASAAKAGGTKMMETLAPAWLDSLLNGVEYGPVKVRLTTFARRYATNNVGAVFNHLLGMKTAFRAGKALDDNFGVFVD